MADEKHSVVPEVLSRHPEKFAFGAALAALVAGIMILSTGSRDVKPFERAREGEFKPPAYQSPFVHQPSAAALPMPAWGQSYATKFTEELKPPPPEQPEVILASPHLEIRKTDFEHIEISWTLEPRKGATLDHFELDRMTKGAWKTIASRLEPKVASFIDRDVAPRQEYIYRLRAVARETKVRPSVSTTVAARTPSPFSIAVFQASADEICFMIERVDRGAKEMFRVRPGDAIGAERVISLRGSEARVDFTTGWTLLRIEKGQPVEERICDFVHGSKGKEHKGEIRRPLPIPAWKATCRDENGREQVVWSREPQVRDNRCPEHKGK